MPAERMHGQMSAETKRKEREEETGRKQEKEDRRKGMGGERWRVGRRKESLDLIPPSSLGINSPLYCSVLPSLPTGELWLSPAHLPGIPHTVSSTPGRTDPILSYKMNVLFGQKKRRKFDVEKIWDLEIQLTALLWKEKLLQSLGRTAGRQQSQQQHWSWRRQGYGQETWGLVRELPGGTHLQPGET